MLWTTYVLIDRPVDVIDFQEKYKQSTTKFVKIIFFSSNQHNILFTNFTRITFRLPRLKLAMLIYIVTSVEGRSVRCRLQLILIHKCMLMFEIYAKVPTTCLTLPLHGETEFRFCLYQKYMVCWTHIKPLESYVEKFVTHSDVPKYIDEHIAEEYNNLHY